jgi:hypothetical protein
LISKRCHPEHSYRAGAMKKSGTAKRGEGSPEKTKPGRINAGDSSQSARLGMTENHV